MSYKTHNPNPTFESLRKKLKTNNKLNNQK